MSGRHLRRPHRVDPRVAILVALASLVGALAGFLAGRDPGPETVEATGPVLRPGSDATAAAVPDPGPIVLAFVGDIAPIGSLEDRLAEQPDDFVGLFAPLLHEADLVVANVEAAITDTGEPVDKRFVFTAPAAILPALAAGGVDVVSVANDHSLDHGAEGLVGTLAIAAATPHPSLVGLGADEDAAYRPSVHVIGGQRVAVLAATQILDAERIASSTARADRPGVASAKRITRLVRAVEDARAEADTVVVYLSWGLEGEECPSAGQQELASALVAAGADVVVGANAHRVLGAGRLGDAVVHYGLGNFLFPPGSTASTSTGVFLVTIDGRDVIETDWRPGRIIDGVPEPLEGDDAVAATEEFDELRSCTGLDA